MNSPKTKKKRKPATVKGILMEELDLVSDIVFRLNLPQKIKKKKKVVAKSSGKAAATGYSYVPISVTFRARRYPVRTSAFPKESKNPLGDVDDLLKWPALHHTVSWIRGIHMLDLERVFKRNISRKIMMEDVVARIGGRATLDLVFPQLIRDSFHSMINDDYEGSKNVTNLKQNGFPDKAEDLRKREILSMVNSRTRKSWGANRIIPVWFLIWIFEWDYLQPHFLKFNAKFGICSQIADAMRCKMQTGSGSNDIDRELLNQSRKIMKSMEIVSSQGDLTLLQSRTRDLVSIDLACRRLFNRRERSWNTRNPNASPAEAEEVWSSSSASKRMRLENKDSIPDRVSDLEEAVDTEILVTSGKMERMKSDIRMLALKIHIMERQHNTSQTNSNTKQKRNLFSSLDSQDSAEENEKNIEYYDSFQIQKNPSLAVSDSSSDLSETFTSSSSSSSSEEEEEDERKVLEKPGKRPRWMKQRHKREKKRGQKKQRRRY